MSENYAYYFRLYIGFILAPFFLFNLFLFYYYNFSTYLTIIFLVPPVVVFILFNRKIRIIGDELQQFLIFILASLFPLFFLPVNIFLGPETPARVECSITRAAPGETGSKSKRAIVRLQVECENGDGYAKDSFNLDYRKGDLVTIQMFQGLLGIDYSPRTIR